MNIIFIFLIAVSLSMDAFSLSLAYGTISMSRKEINALSTIVGIYHFFMPILGMLFGNLIFNILHINSKLIVLIIFSFIGINMIVESFKNEEKVKKMKLTEMALFGLAVSVDSFSLGIGLNNISDNFIMCSIIFSITSFSFTYVGLKLGNKLNQMIGKVSTIIGGMALILFGLFYIIK